MYASGDFKPTKSFSNSEKVIQSENEGFRKAQIKNKDMVGILSSEMVNQTF